MGIQEYLNTVTVREAAIGIAGIIGVLAAFVSVYSRITPTIIKMWQYMSVYYKVPTLCKNIDESLKEIRAELRPNGGSSLKDAINRIERRQILYEGRNKALLMNIHYPIFETDIEGNCVFVNNAYCMMTGRDFDTSRNNGWMTSVAKEDRESVYKAWNCSIEEGIEFDETYTIIHADGTRYSVRCNTVRMFDEQRKLLGYMGFITILSKTPPKGT